MTPLTTRSARLSRVMGCRGRLEVTASARRADQLVAAAEQRVAHLERCWSRFLVDSDVSRINRSPGGAVVVDPTTITLLIAMAAGASATGARFDPTLFGPIVGLGYGPPWPSSARERTDVGGARTERLRWIADTFVGPTRSTVALADGVQLDPGAIGKGLAADIIAAELIDRGADAARIDIGGDVCVTSASIVGVRDPGGRLGDRIAIAAGGVATSGTGRRWIGPSGHEVHHVLDPRTHEPLARSSPDSVVQVSVAATSAADAEVFATALLVDTSAAYRAEVDRRGLAVRSVTGRGDVDENEAWRRLRRDAARGEAVA